MQAESPGSGRICGAPFACSLRYGRPGGLSAVPFVKMRAPGRLLASLVESGYLP